MDDPRATPAPYAPAPSSPVLDAAPVGRRVAILQSNYIPWKGYFDLIHSVDEFILYDDMQYTRRDWRNRNKIKTKDGLLWLTIPVEVKGRYHQKIRETVISDPDWNRHHRRVLATSYAKAPHFRRYAEFFEALYLGCSARLLSEVNYRFLTAVCGLLGIRTRISWSADYELAEGKTERLVSLCRQAGAAEYLSGPAAREYIEPERFAEAGIRLRYMDYSGYPEYPQLFPPFEHGVSVLDLIFNVGPDAPRYMKSF
jgi:hypothetical protein